MKTLREDRRQFHSEKMATHPDQGKIFHCFKKCPESNTFIRDGKYTRFADWRFIHGARLNLKNLNATKRSKNGHNIMCRHCGRHHETLPYVRKHCGSMMKEVRAHYNQIIKRLKDAEIYKNKWANYAENQPLGSEKLRPDLVLIRNKALVMDVVCPFENGHDALDKACTDKVQKYAKLCNDPLQPKSNLDVVRKFQKNVLETHVETMLTNIQKKIPLDNLLLKSVSAIDPTCRMHSFSLKLMKCLPDLVTNVLSGGERDAYDKEVHRYHSANLRQPQRKESVNNWWMEIKNSRQFPLLSKMAYALLTCFHGPKVESSFSFMNSVVTSE